MLLLRAGEHMASGEAADKRRPESLGPACNAEARLLAGRFPALAQPASCRPSGRSSGVEHNLAKVGVEGSNPFARSNFQRCSRCRGQPFRAATATGA